MDRSKLITTIKTQYAKDKKWCIEYHNNGDVAMYNMIFGRLQSYAIVDDRTDLGLGLAEDMKKNIPWNKKMLAAYYKEIVEFNPSDVENFESFE